MSRNTFLNQLWQRRVVRFAAVGVINTLTDLAILNVLVFAFGFKVLVANSISASVGVILSYFWNHVIVFQRQHKLSVRLFVKFVAVTGVSIIAVQSLIIYGFEHLVTARDLTSLTHLTHSQVHFIQVDLAKLVAVLGGMVWNYILYNKIVFKTPPIKPDIDDEGIVPY